MVVEGKVVFQGMGNVELVAPWWKCPPRDLVGEEVFRQIFLDARSQLSLLLLRFTETSIFLSSVLLQWTSSFSQSLLEGWVKKLWMKVPWELIQGLLESVQDLTVSLGWWFYLLVWKRGPLVLEGSLFSLHAGNLLPTFVDLSLVLSLLQHLLCCCCGYFGGGCGNGWLLS